MRTPITYYGGKTTMLKHILPLIPPHKLYTEAFCGGAAVLFAKRPADAEVINDINMEITNFYWIAKAYYPDLKAEIDKTLHSRDIHAHAGHINAYPEFFTPVQRAWAVWALCKMSFASMMDGTFGYDFSGAMPKKLRNGVLLVSSLLFYAWGEPLYVFLMIGTILLFLYSKTRAKKGSLTKE